MDYSGEKSSEYIKLFGGVVIKSLVVCLEHVIGEEQCIIRRGRSCVDQVLSVKNF